MTNLSIISQYTFDMNTLSKLSPIIAFMIIVTLDLEGTLAQALLIASSFPTSRNSALFALEYGNHSEYAAQVVLMSTLLSSITVTIVEYVAKILF
jgi:malate permease and related proteins